MERGLETQETADDHRKQLVQDQIEGFGKSSDTQGHKDLFLSRHRDHSLRSDSDARPCHKKEVGHDLSDFLLLFRKYKNISNAGEEGKG